VHGNRGEQLACCVSLVGKPRSASRQQYQRAASACRRWRSDPRFDQAVTGLVVAAAVLIVLETLTDR